MISVHLSCTAENLKAMLYYVRDLELANITQSNYLKKQDRNSTSLVALIFLRIWCMIIWFFTCLIFWMHLLIKWLEAAIHSCARKIVCSEKLQGGPLDLNPRKMPAENSWIIILQSNSKCLLSNDKQMPREILFSFLEKQSSRGVL